LLQEHDVDRAEFEYREAELAQLVISQREEFAHESVSPVRCKKIVWPG
jgi:hypothetical protein